MMGSLFLGSLLWTGMQDQPMFDGYREFLKKPDRETADGAMYVVQRTIDNLTPEKDQEPPPFLFSLYLVAGLYAPKGGYAATDLEPIGKHLDRLAETKPDVERHLLLAEEAAKSKGLPSRLVAIGHLATALQLKAPAEKIAPIAQAAGLVEHEGTWVMPELVTLAKMRKEAKGLEGWEAVGTSREYAKETSTAIRYFRMNCLLRATCKNRDRYPDLVRSFNELKFDGVVAEHIECLRKAMAVYFECNQCKGTRTQVCSACKGKGEREVVCPSCHGKDDYQIEHEGRTNTGQMIKQKACPTCIGRAEWKKRKQKCEYCEGKGRVECQRCRYLQPRYEDVIQEKDCLRCKKSGTLFNPKIVCYFCWGMGVQCIPTSAPDKKPGIRE